MFVVSLSVGITISYRDEAPVRMEASHSIHFMELVSHLFFFWGGGEGGI